LTVRITIGNRVAQNVAVSQALIFPKARLRVGKFSRFLGAIAAIQRPSLLLIHGHFLFRQGRLEKEDGDHDQQGENARGKSQSRTEQSQPRAGPLLSVRGFGKLPRHLPLKQAAGGRMQLH
jgi:hypothetical protein